MSGIRWAGCLSAAAISSALSVAAFCDEGSRPPNVLIIIADDLGYGELGCYGGTQIPTPNLDSLAARGVRFTNGYVSGCVCSPTRAGLMTGRYQQRFGHEFNPKNVGTVEFGLPLGERTLADRMKAAGHATGIVGKWHLGEKEQFHPQRRGFQEFFGFLGSMHSYLPEGGRGARGLIRGTERIDPSDYLTDTLAREAVAFLDRHESEPFFLYLAFNAVHTPMEATDHYLQRFPDIKKRDRRTFAAMLSALDDGVGTVLAGLRERGLEDNTLIVFLSDNGGPTGLTTSDNGPLSGGKGDLGEGGIRVPFIIQWPDRLSAGTVYEQPVIALDILPTAASAVGASLPEDATLDGVDLLPFLNGERTDRPHERLYWRDGIESAVRDGDWKLFETDSAPSGLYDLSQDIGERRDLSAAEPQRVEQMHAAISAWRAELVEPLWHGEKQKRQDRRRRQNAAGDLQRPDASSREFSGLAHASRR